MTETDRNASAPGGAGAPAPAPTGKQKLHPLFPGRAFISTVLDVLDSKESMSAKMLGTYVQRAAMAGFFAAFFFTTYFVILAVTARAGEGWAMAGRFLAPIAFGWALVLIYYTNSELLTSNMMVVSIGSYYKRISWSHSLRLLAWCLLGNLVGALLVAVLLRMSTVVSPDVLAQMQAAVAKKLAFVQAGPTGWLDLAVRAALCNFCINIAMLMVFNGKIDDDLTKCINMVVAVFVFAFDGFEHSIADSALFLIAGLHAGVDVPAAIACVVIAILGNFVGGGVLIGLNFAIMNNEGRRG